MAWNKVNAVLLSAALAFSIGFVADAEAKRSGGSKSSYSSSSFKTSSSWSSSSKKSSSSWGSSKSYSSSSKKTSSWGSSSSSSKKKNTWVAGSSSTKKNTWSSSKTSSTKTVTSGKQTVKKASSQSIKKTQTASVSSVGKKQKVATSRTAFKQQKAAFKQRKPVATASSGSSRSSTTTNTYSYNKRSPIVQKTVIINNRSTYYQRRGSYYNSWDTPSYSYNSYSSFGVWDSMALWFMLDHINDQNQMRLYYNHMNSPGMQEWRREADRLAADNADLRRKLNALDAEQNKLAATGMKRDESYVPEGVDADLLLASEVLEDNKPVIRMCTGAMTQNYYNVAKIIGRDMQSARIVPVETNGSADNLRKLENGQCDGAIVQRDAYLSHVEQFPASKLDFTRVLSPYAEIPHLVCPYDSGVTKLSHLDSDHTVLVGKPGSGSAVTWSNLVAEDSSYGKVKTENVGGALALARLSTDRNACVLSVSGLNTKFMRDVDNIGKTTKLQLVAWNDGDIFDAVDPTGEQLYHDYTLPSGKYPNIQKTAWHTMASSTDVVTVPADVILNNSWVQQNEKAFEFLVSEAAGKIPTIRQYVGGQQ